MAEDSAENSSGFEEFEESSEAAVTEEFAEKPSSPAPQAPDRSGLLPIPVPSDVLPEVSGGSGPLCSAQVPTLAERQSRSEPVDLLMTFFAPSTLVDALKQNQWSVEEELRIVTEIARDPGSADKVRLAAVSLIRSRILEVLTMQGRVVECQATTRSALGSGAGGSPGSPGSPGLPGLPEAELMVRGLTMAGEVARVIDKQRQALGARSLAEPVSGPNKHEQPGIEGLGQPPRIPSNTQNGDDHGSEVLQGFQGFQGFHEFQAETPTSSA